MSSLAMLYFAKICSLWFFEFSQFLCCVSRSRTWKTHVPTARYRTNITTLSISNFVLSETSILPVSLGRKALGDQLHQTIKKNFLRVSSHLYNNKKGYIQSLTFHCQWTFTYIINYWRVVKNFDICSQYIITIWQDKLQFVMVKTYRRCQVNG